MRKYIYILVLFSVNIMSYGQDDDYNIEIVESIYDVEKDEDKILSLISDIANGRVDKMIANSICENSKYYDFYLGVYNPDTLLLTTNRNNDGSYTFPINDFNVESDCN